MAGRMSRKLIAMSSSAIAAIYFAGYLATQRVDAGLGGTEGSTATPIAAPAPPVGTPAPQPYLAQPSPPFSGTNTNASYLDGTYQGSGTSRRGGVDLAVTIQGGRITNVSFTRVTTQYPVSRIAALPGEVVQRQSGQVDRITGATYSVQAFQQAVQQALAKAQQSGGSASASSAASPAPGA